MKRLFTSLIVSIISVVTLHAMTYAQACREALFLTDKMAYELGLSESQYDAVYEINLDYLMALSSQDDLYSTCWTRRNLDLSYVLTASQYNIYIAAVYFYRPVYWDSGFRYRIYTRYTDMSFYYYSRPSVYLSYRGGHSWTSNGGKSWYMGKTFDNSTKMTTIRTGTTNHSGNRGTTAVTSSRPAASGHSVTAPVTSTRPASSGNSSTSTRPSANRPSRTTGSSGTSATARPSRTTGSSGTSATKSSGSFSGSRTSGNTSGKSAAGSSASRPSTSGSKSSASGSKTTSGSFGGKR